MTLADLITQHCADLGDNYPAIAERLNAPTSVENPVKAAPTIAHPPTLKEIYSQIPVSEAAGIYSKPGLSADIRNAIDSGDPEYLTMMLAIVSAMDIISDATVGKLATLLARTQPDPSWSATIAGPSLASAAGLGTVTPAMVQAVLNG